MFQQLLDELKKATQEVATKLNNKKEREWLKNVSTIIRRVKKSNTRSG